MQRIEIKNFRQIRDAKVLVNGLTVIIGEQASGKSTVAKLVYFFKSLQENLVSVARLNPNDINGQKIANRVRDEFFRYFGSTKRLPEDYQIRFYYTDEKYISLNSSPLRVDFVPNDWFNEIEHEIRRASKPINFYREKEDYDSADQEERILIRVLADLFRDQQTAQYIPAGRNIVAAYLDEQHEIFTKLTENSSELKYGPDGEPRRQDGEAIDLILLRDFTTHCRKIRTPYKGGGMVEMLRNLGSDRYAPEHLVRLRAKKHLTEVIAGMMKGKYSYTDTAGEFFLLDDEKRTRVQMGKASSGQQESIRIVLDIVWQIVNQAPVFRVVEEPEAHLFPTGQYALMKLLAALLNAHEPNSGLHNQMFVTTHSPYLAKILNNLVFASDLAHETAAHSRALDRVIPEIFRIEPSRLSAYMLKDGECHPINDTAGTGPQAVASDGPITGIIGGNLLDNYWNDLYNEFETLLEIGA